MAYGWITTAPIRKIDKNEAGSVIFDLLCNIESWGEGSEKWDTARRYHSNKKGAIELLEILDKLGVDGDNYVYDYGGLVVGLLIVEPKNGYVYICDLLVHPGTEGGGAILLEYAVNLSQNQGSAGKLQLYSLNQNASDFYLKMGFVRTKTATYSGGGDMSFDPASSDLWTLKNKTWALKAYVGKKFAGEIN